MKCDTDVLTWLEENLTSILSHSLSRENIRYIAEIDNKKDVEEYLGTLLDFNVPAHKQFCENYLIIRNIKEKNKSTKNKKPLNLTTDGVDFSLEDDGESKSPQSSDSSKKKKRDKFVNLYSKEGANKDVVILKGRHFCNCQAAKHRLINNCLNCGRIVCSQEGSGPCLFCGNLVCSKEEQELINCSSEESKKLRVNLMKAGYPEGWENALAHRDRLLEFDRTSQRRTRVIDDEGEYYSSTSVWLSPNERRKMEKKEQAAIDKKTSSRLSQKFVLDFAGRQVVEDEENYDDEHSDYEDAVDWDSTLPNNDASLGWQPEYVPSGYLERLPLQMQKLSVTTPRVQDKELLEMSDGGACLSMHQPWASLLVHGIKRHEGRTWFSPHRGRLWIAAASKVPTNSEIKETEEFHRLLRHDEFEEGTLRFPKHYATSCLLGCVNLVDCLPQEEYQNRFETSESDSPFVFICEDPVAFNTKFPVSGKHKIYQLDKQIHTAALKMLFRQAKENAK